MARPAGSKNKTTVSKAVEEAVDELKSDIPQIVEDAVKEALEEIKEDQTHPENLPEPPVEYRTQEETMGAPRVIDIPKEVVVTQEQNGDIALSMPENKILVDKELFYRLMVTSVKGIPHRGNAAVSKFAQCVGITDSEAQNKFWQEEVQKYLEAHNG